MRATFADERTATWYTAICNGLAAYGGFIPFGATFLNFIGYALGAVTLSALSHLQVLFASITIIIAIGVELVWKALIGSRHTRRCSTS